MEIKKRAHNTENVDVLLHPTNNNTISSHTVSLKFM